MATLRQLLYLSRAATPLTDLDVRQILAVSQRNNRRRDITGCLLYSGKHFAQVLEGAGAVVEELVGRIAKDPRHQDVVVAVDRSITTRRFAQWSMGMLYRLELADRLEEVLVSKQVSAELADELFGSIQPDSVMGAL